MFEGFAVVAALKSAGVTHVVWIPDSELGRWDAALAGPEGLPTIRVCREGEAFAIAAGLTLGGAKPLVVLQCTGLFEAGDSLRNILHDLKLPIVFVVGVRSHYAHARGESSDTCPVFTEPILRAWNIPYTLLDDRHGPSDLAEAILQARRDVRAFAILIAE